MTNCWPSKSWNKKFRNQFWYDTVGGILAGAGDDTISGFQPTRPILGSSSLRIGNILHIEESLDQWTYFPFNNYHYHIAVKGLFLPPGYWAEPFWTKPINQQILDKYQEIHSNLFHCPFCGQDFAKYCHVTKLLPKIIGWSPQNRLQYFQFRLLLCFQAVSNKKLWGKKAKSVIYLTSIVFLWCWSLTFQINVKCIQHPISWDCRWKRKNWVGEEW